MVKNAGHSGASEAVDPVYKLSEDQRLRYLSVIEHMHDMDESIKEAETKRAIIKSREEGREEGIEEGIAKGRKEGIAKGRKEGIAKGRFELSQEIEDKLRKLNLTQEQIDSVLKH